MEESHPQEPRWKDEADYWKFRCRAAENEVEYYRDRAHTAEGDNRTLKVTMLKAYQALIALTYKPPTADEHAAREARRIAADAAKIGVDLLDVLRKHE